MIYIDFEFFIPTDQETLRNITTPNLEVDFPQELFEGVSDMAKDFIRVCLNRNPK